MKLTPTIYLSCFAVLVATLSAAPVPLLRPEPDGTRGNVVRGLAARLTATPIAGVDAVKTARQAFKVEMRNGPAHLTLAEPDTDHFLVVRTFDGEFDWHARGFSLNRAEWQRARNKVEVKPGFAWTWEAESRFIEPANLSDRVRKKIDSTRPYCVTAVFPKLGLRSNTVFVNGRFNLPRGFDPLVDSKTTERLIEDHVRSTLTGGKK